MNNQTLVHSSYESRALLCVVTRQMSLNNHPYSVGFKDLRISIAVFEQIETCKEKLFSIVVWHHVQDLYKVLGYNG